jgi:hypothetical protein
MPHFVMVGEGPYPSVSISKGPDLPGGPWYHGHALQIQVPEVLEYTLDVEPPYYEEDDEDTDGHTDGESRGTKERRLVIPTSRPKVLLNAEAFPVMRTDLLETLVKVGVDNLQTYPARLVDEINHVVYENYVAFNVIGLVAAADLGRSKLAPHPAGPSLLDTDFDALAVDESKARGLLLFRLAEKCSAIVVDHRVKEAVEKSRIPGIVFYADMEWAG